MRQKSDNPCDLDMADRLIFDAQLMPALYVTENVCVVH